jgi:hypothetical protein
MRPSRHGSPDSLTTLDNAFSRHYLFRLKGKHRGISKGEPISPTQWYATAFRNFYVVNFRPVRALIYEIPVPTITNDHTM